MAETADSSRAIRPQAADTDIYHIIGAEITAFLNFIKYAGQQQGCPPFVQSAAGNVFFKIGIQILVYTAKSHGVTSLQDKCRMNQPYQLQGLLEGLRRVIRNKTAVGGNIRMIFFLGALGVIQYISFKGRKAYAHCRYSCFQSALIIGGKMVGVGNKII